MGAVMLLRSFLVVLPLALAGDLILNPTRSSGQPAGLIWIQGAQVPTDRYTPLLQAVQNASQLRLWVGLPSSPLDTPNPETLPKAISQILDQMYTAGLPKDAILLYGGHSLGSIMVQIYVEAHAPNATALVLSGGFLARKYFANDFPVPTLTIGGELDGLARVTRVGAESYYNLITLKSNPAAAAKRFPVVVVPGMNHWQFASGAPTRLVSTMDLIPEVSDADAQATASVLIADFLDNCSGVSGTGEEVAAAVAQTATFIGPLVKAYEQEGSRHFNAPSQIGGPNAAACVQGGCPSSSAWAPRAQVLIAGDLGQFGYTGNVTNQYVSVSSNPVTGGVFHLPSITPNNQTDVVTITTFTQGSWNKLDNVDTGFVSTSASELATKLASRQCTWIEVSGQDFNFSVDDPDFCMQTNMQAYQWALDAASKTARDRFEAFGEQFIFGPDIQKSGGPWFIDALLAFDKVEINGTKFVRVTAPAQKTPKDYWPFPFPRPSSIPDPSCFHYCKLLSPARAMEWIYVDGLRAQRSNLTQCESCVDAGQHFCWRDLNCYAPSNKTSPCSAAQCVAKSGCTCDTCFDPTCAYNGEHPKAVREALQPSF
eukprot:c11092_g1_i2.p1 GENE.c11092_g1_i2~~c11092_g1_i2.p1  ORF type:complete len:597 (+),score=103.96 c11092_g1_i2:1-1791(+)